MLVALAAHHGWPLSHMDIIITTSLNGEIQGARLHHSTSRIF